MFELNFNENSNTNTGTISKMLSDNTLIELNAFEENTLSNEYDFERRSKVFKSINKEETFKMG